MQDIKSSSVKNCRDILSQLQSQPPLGNHFGYRMDGYKKGWEFEVGQEGIRSWILNQRPYGMATPSS